MAALNDLEVKAADVLNNFVTAPNREKQKFGDDVGKSAIIVRVYSRCIILSTSCTVHAGVRV